MERAMPVEPQADRGPREKRIPHLEPLVRAHGRLSRPDPEQTYQSGCSIERVVWDRGADYLARE